MATLIEVQEALYNCIYKDDYMAAEFMIANNGGVSAKGRLSIYHDNTQITLRNNLERKYKTVANIVDSRFFSYTASEFIKMYKPVTANLNDYGIEMPEFLANFEKTQHISYLPEMARLEWLRHVAQFMPDGEEINPFELNKVPKELYSKILFTVQPSAVFMESKFPIDNIWQVSQPNYKGEVRVDMQSGPVYMLVVRPHQNVEMFSLSKGDYVFLQAIQKGALLYAAYEEASKQDPNFDLTSAIERFVGDHVFSGFAIEGFALGKEIE